MACWRWEMPVIKGRPCALLVHVCFSGAEWCPYISPCCIEMSSVQVFHVIHLGQHQLLMLMLGEPLAPVLCGYLDFMALIPRITRLTQGEFASLVDSSWTAFEMFPMSISLPGEWKAVDDDKWIYLWVDITMALGFWTIQYLETDPLELKSYAYIFGDMLHWLQWVLLLSKHAKDGATGDLGTLWS